jgi:thiol-disulfide isomerase/thioredoxin
MKTNLKYSVGVILLLIAAMSQPIWAQSVTPARAAVVHASPEEVKKLQEAVEAAPDNPAAHKAYIKAVGVNDPMLVSQYKKWMEKYPQNIIIPFAIGEAFYNQEQPQAKEYLLKVAEMDPKMAKVWYMLSIDADRWGQKSMSTEYMKKANLADPADPAYAFYYTMTFENGDHELYKQKIFELAKRYPENERGAQGLYWLAERSANNEDKIKYFEQLRALYPPKKFNWSASGMEGLWAAYLETDPAKALSLVNEMNDDKLWKSLRALSENIVEERKLAENKDYKGAITLLAQTKLPRYPDVSDFYYQEQASLHEKSGDVKGAYDSLAVKFAKTPTEKLLASTQQYGKKLGKNNSQIQQDIQNIRASTAVAAYPFDLGMYTSKSNLSLKDLKGKVVLLTFWFPGCGPCRGEFPHFQKVMDKYKGQDVVYVGINVSPEQDPYVIPFMENTKYSFIPLRGTSEFAAKSFGVRGEPENFLIDQNGKIVFKNFRIEGNNEHSLEMMITSLLKKGS